MSAAAIADIVSRGGGPPGGTTASQWVALALNESGGRYECVNEADAVGLWQVRTLHAGTAFPGWSASGSRPQFREWLKNPQNNWTAARVIYGRQGWGAWSASHRPTAASDAAVAEPNRDEATRASGIDPGLDVPGPVDEAVDTLTDIGGAIAGFFEWVTDPNTWKRIALVIAGGGIVLVGTAAVLRGTEVGKQVEDIATGVASKGAAKKGA